MDDRRLLEFLRQARLAGYANLEGASPEEEGSRSSFSDGRWSYVDRYVGGDPFAGQEVVMLDDRPVWSCVYYGLAREDSNAADVFAALREALRLPPSVAYGRGPMSAAIGDLTYGCLFEGSVARFRGREWLLDSNGVEVYSADFLGGLVNRREAL